MNFLNLMVIPGCVLIFLHCTSFGIMISSLRVGIANYILTEVRLVIVSTTGSAKHALVLETELAAR